MTNFSVRHIKGYIKLHNVMGITQQIDPRSFILVIKIFDSWFIGHLGSAMFNCEVANLDAYCFITALIVLQSLLRYTKYTIHVMLRCLC